MVQIHQDRCRTKWNKKKSKDKFSNTRESYEFNGSKTKKVFVDLTIFT